MNNRLNNKELLVVQNALSLLMEKAIFSEFSLSCFNEDGNLEFFTEEEGIIANEVLQKLGLEYNR